MLRTVVLAAARSSRVERLVERTPVTRDVVRRFVAGTTAAEALRVTRELADDGLLASIDYLGEDTTTPEQAEATKDEYLRLLKSLEEEALADRAEVSVKLSALGLVFDEAVAREHAHAICAAADAVGTTVTIDMENHATTDAALDTVFSLRTDFPATGAVVQAYLRRTEADCRELATAGSRVRLCKGAYAEPESVAFQSALDVDKSYVRCLNILMAGDGYPMIATHDPRLLAIGEDRAKWFDRSTDDFEFQMLYGARPDEQRRLADEGHSVRVYVPYGTQWYSYLMRRLAERPRNLAFFLRAMRSTR